MNDLLKALQIMMKYAPDGNVCAEHDVIYFDPAVTKEMLTEDELKFLLPDEHDLPGCMCHWDDDADCFAMFV